MSRTGDEIHACTRCRRSDYCGKYVKAFTRDTLNSKFNLWRHPREHVLSSSLRPSTDLHFHTMFVLFATCDVRQKDGARIATSETVDSRLTVSSITMIFLFSGGRRRGDAMVMRRGKLNEIWFTCTFYRIECAYVYSMCIDQWHRTNGRLISITYLFSLSLWHLYWNEIFLAEINSNIISKVLRNSLVWRVHACEKFTYSNII